MFYAFRQQRKFFFEVMLGVLSPLRLNINVLWGGKGGKERPGGRVAGTECVLRQQSLSDCSFTFSCSHVSLFSHFHVSCRIALSCFHVLKSHYSLKFPLRTCTRWITCTVCVRVLCGAGSRFEALWAGPCAGHTRSR